ncbi:MAG: MFS transporter, partial [Ktedonobacteraceae bacterium]|nr:MFS transporter [Ktedonobacteraceae bacterium]
MRFRILVLALGTFAIGTDGLVIAGILPAMAHDLRISVDTAGLLVTGFAWIYALGSPVLAAVTGRVPRKQLLLSGLVVFLSANILAALATNFWLLLAARVLAALGAALYTPVASTVASAMVPPEMRGRALAIVLAGMTVATVMGVPLGIIVAAQFGWQMTFWVVAVLSIIAFIGVLALLPAVANPPAVGLKTRLAMLRDPVLVLMLLNATMWLIANF